MDKIKTLSVFLVVLSFLIGAYFYPYLPEQMASHWNMAGEVDDYMPKFWGTFLLPIFSVFLLALFFIIPKIDPLKENVQKFRKEFNTFILIFEFFFFYIYLLSIYWSLGVRFDMTAAIMPGLGLLFYYVGILLGRAERNYFIGIRTPWTLASDAVWKKTHLLGSKLFKAVGVLAALAFFFPSYSFFLMFVPIIFVSLYLTVYSYLEFRKEKSTNR